MNATPASSLPDVQRFADTRKLALTRVGVMYGIIKRPDEKFVTERAYDNPKFVEDLVRDVALQLNEDARVRSYRVAAENFESIHNHSAYAQIECKSTPHSLDRARPRHAHQIDVLEPN